MTNDQQAYALWLETLPDLYTQLDATCAEQGRIITKQQAEIDRLRAELAMWEHRDECAAYAIGGVICAECDRLEAAAKAAEGKS